MRRPQRLRSRLALVAVGTVGIWVVLLTTGFNLLLAQQLHGQAGSLLEQRAALGAAEVVVDGRHRVALREPANDLALDANLWVYAGGQALERPRAGSRLQAAADRLATSGRRYLQTDEPGAVRLYARPVVVDGSRVATVVAAVPLDPYDTTARLALLGSIGLALLLLAGVYGATRVIVARALTPVQQMSAQAAQWSEQDPAQRFDRHGRPAELAGLADNLNGLLDRVAALVRHEQQVTEELSHELRTPLSLITAETDLLQARHRSGAETGAAVTRIGTAAGRMTQILETLLTAARTRSQAQVGRCDLLEVAAAAVEEVPNAAVHGSRVAAGVDGAVVERILGPLLDNASRYARSRIDLDVAEVGQWAVLRVRDDGPGVDAELGEGAFEPGRRGSADAHPGAGLGLALARRLARATGGDLVLTTGGFEVQLPRA